MYLDFFGFKEPPFSISPNPKYLFMSRQHQDALAHLLYSLETSGGFVLLTGEVGTGKTTITRCFLEKVPDNAQIAYVMHPKLSAVDLLATICDELSIPYRRSQDDLKWLIDSIHRHLLHNFSLGRRTILIIDEAQNLSISVLEQIRLLTNLETDEAKLMNIILIGQPELREIFVKPQLRQLNQRITARCHLHNLNLNDTWEYIQHRLKIAGAISNPFTFNVAKMIHRLTGGVPRLMNVICDRALLGAYASESRQVTPAVLKKSAFEVLDEEASQSGSVKRSTGDSSWVGLVLVIILLTFFVGVAWLKTNPNTASLPLNKTEQKSIEKELSPHTKKENNVPTRSVRDELINRLKKPVSNIKNPSENVRPLFQPVTDQAISFLLIQETIKS
ncbi:MAG: AAA family ATPase [Pseudomonadota bacterium]